MDVMFFKLERAPGSLLGPKGLRNSITHHVNLRRRGGGFFPQRANVKFNRFVRNALFDAPWNARSMLSFFLSLSFVDPSRSCSATLTVKKRVLLCALFVTEILAGRLFAAKARTPSWKIESRGCIASRETLLSFIAFNNELQMSGQDTLLWIASERFIFIPARWLMVEISLAKQAYKLCTPGRC